MIKRIIKLCISVLVHGVDQLSILFSEIVGNKIYPRCVVLYYHSVKEVQRERFVRQLDEIVRLAKPVSLDSKDSYLGGLNHVAVTFDDGFISLLQNAIPDLVNRNMSFSVFVPTGHIGKAPSWIKNINSFQSKYEQVMDQEQLKELVKVKNAAIGSHCITHRNLVTLPDDEAKKEIFESKSTLEKILDRKISTLSFPHGGYSLKHLEFAKQAGYERVYSIIPTIATNDKYITGRIQVDPDDWMLEFRLKICGAYRWLPVAYAAKKALLKH